MGIILFIISFLLVFVSSYLLTSIIAPKKSVLGFIYLFLIAFAQLVLIFEILSLFTAIKEFWVLTANVLFFAISVYFWNEKNRPFWSLDCKDFRNRVNNSFKLDKYLMLLYVGFTVSIIASLILCLIMPLTSADAGIYHVARSLFWVLQGSLKHFEIADVRALCLPINSEILYSWVILFIKKDVFLGLFSFVGYLLSIVSIYNMLGYLGYCMRKKLWVIFILSSFASVIVQLSGTETDIIIAGLVSSSIFLFWYALKNNKTAPIFMSSLAYALAIGTKTTSIIAIPGVGLFLLALCIIFKKYKPLAWFLAFGLLNFLIFSSYNYILNFMQFSDFMGSESFMLANRNYYGIKAIPANLIKYIFMFFDFTGTKWGIYFGLPILNFRNTVLASLGLSYIHDGLYTTVLKGELIEPMMGAGILGFLVFLPCLFTALIKPVFKFKSKKIWFIFGFASLFIVNLLSISYLLAFMTYSVRFIMSFMVLSSPILVYSYFKRGNFLKFLIVFFALNCLILVSTNLWARPLSKMGKVFMMSHSITDLRLRAKCKNFDKETSYVNFTCFLKDKLKHNFSNKNRILAFLGDEDYNYILKSLEFDGYKIDFKTMEDAENIDFDKYNLIISASEGQTSTVIKDYERRKNELKIFQNRIISTNGNLVPCFYKKNPKLPVLNNGIEKHPYEVRCVMSKEFLKKKNLKLIDDMGTIDAKARKMNYYYIYRNGNLPLIAK